MDKKGFIWYLFEREGLFFLLGIIVGMVVTVLIAKGIIPLPLDLGICPAPVQ